MSRVDDRMNQLASLGLFAGIPRKQLHTALSYFTPIRVKAGQTFIHQGEVGSEYFLIVSGVAVVERDGDVVAEIGPGQGCGEIALLSDDHRRNASVVAITDLETLVANRREFASLLDTLPTVASRILTGAVTRLAAPAPA